MSPPPTHPPSAEMLSQETYDTKVKSLVVFDKEGPRHIGLSDHSQF